MEVIILQRIPPLMIFQKRQTVGHPLLPVQLRKHHIQHFTLCLSVPHSVKRLPQPRLAIIQLRVPEIIRLQHDHLRLLIRERLLQKKIGRCHSLLRTSHIIGGDPVLAPQHIRLHAIIQMAAPQEQHIQRILFHIVKGMDHIRFRTALPAQHL